MALLESLNSLSQASASRSFDCEPTFQIGLAQRPPSVHFELLGKATPLFLKMGEMPLNLWRKLRSGWPPFEERSNKKVVPMLIASRKRLFWCSRWQPSRVEVPSTLFPIPHAWASVFGSCPGLIPKSWSVGSGNTWRRFLGKTCG